MEFCKNCDNYLSIKESRDVQAKTFSLVYKCDNCEYTEECKNCTVFKKVYKKDTIPTTTSDKFINKYKLKDPTLPKKKSHCPKCDTIDVNPYQVKYVNNSFNILSICSTCCEVFKYKKVK